jgi:hypothetical protein
VVPRSPKVITPCLPLPLAGLNRTHAPAPGQTAEPAQQFVARHETWMAIDLVAVEAEARFEQGGPAF